MRFLFAILTAFTLAAKGQDTAVLDGSLSRNADKYHWVQTEGEHVEMVNQDSVKCEVVMNDIGQYRFTLIASNECCSAIDSSKVTVISSPLAIEPDSVFRPSVRQQVHELSAKTIIHSNYISLQISSPRVEAMSVSLYDVVGQLLYRQQIELNEGANIESIAYKPASPGIYIMRFTSYFEDVTQKVLITQ